MTYQAISRLTRLSAALAAWGSLGWTVPVLAHGVVLGYEPVSGVEIQARYDTGEPMAEAQVAIYAPDNPTEPWMQGTTDKQGNFIFTPDASQPGNWEVMIRQAGHGGMVTVPVEGPNADDSADPENGDATVAVAPATDSSENLSSVQQGIAIGAVIWGFVGTALFFSRGKG